MALEPHPTEKGLWVASPARTSGVHALIIGISAYPHLDGGTGPPAPATMGMGQLEVSARTATSIFEWLKQRGSAGGALLASCRLCLAPAPGEKAHVDSVTGEHYVDASFATLRKAAESWGDALSAGGRGTEPNVAFFFFSGHGLEHLSSPAMLAQDILNPDSPRGSNNAMAFNSLWLAVRTYGIDRAFFFIDACRNAPELAKTLHIVGQDVLPPATYPGRAPDAVSWLQATRMGEFAYQVPGDEATIFGKGLLEGLEGLPPDHLPYDCREVPWQLAFGDLESHVKQRVRELLRPHSATILQPVEPGGYPYNGAAPVAHKSPDAVPPPAAASAPPPSPEASPAADDLADLVAAGALDEAGSRTIRSRTESILHDFRSTDVTASPDSFPNLLGDFGAMHEILQHESITSPWVHHLEILDLRSGEPIGNDVLQVVAGRSQEAAHGFTAWIDASLAPGAGEFVWVGWQSPHGDGRSAAVVLPRDSYRPLPVRLDLSFHPVPDSWTATLGRMTARLADPARFPDHEVAGWRALWDVQRIEALSDLSRAAHVAGELRILERALQEKMQSPIGAALAAALLLRAGALERLHDWPRNLANWMEWLPDGPILWAETLLRRADAASGDARAAAEDEARDFFERCAERGPPLLGAVLGMAALQAARWRHQLGTEPGPDAERLTLACERIERAAGYAVCGSAFAAFASTGEPLRPAMLFEAAVLA